MDTQPIIDPLSSGIETLGNNFALTTLLIVIGILGIVFIVSTIKWLASVKDKFLVSFQTRRGDKISIGGSGRGHKTNQNNTESDEPALLKKSKPDKTTPMIKLVPWIQNPYFTNLQEMINSNCMFFNTVSDTCSDDMSNKIVLMKAFLRECKLPVFYDRVAEFVRELEISDGENMGLFPSLIWNSVREYEQKARTLNVVLPDGRMCYGIPSVLVSKFNEWHSSRVDSVAHKIQDVLNHSFFHSWQLKLIVILQILDLAFELTKQDANKTLVSLNGEVEEEIRLKLGKR